MEHTRRSFGPSQYKVNGFLDAGPAGADAAAHARRRGSVLGCSVSSVTRVGGSDNVSNRGDIKDIFGAIFYANIFPKF